MPRSVIPSLVIPRSVIPKSITLYQSQLRVSGITMLGSSIYVLRTADYKPISQLEIYNNTNHFQHIKSIDLMSYDIAMPLDIVSFSNNAVFISNFAGRGSLNLLVVSDSPSYRKWEVPARPVGLSYNAQQKLLYVTSPDLEAIRVYRVEYNDLDYVSTMNLVNYATIDLLRYNLGSPEYCVQLSNGNIVVSHQGRIHGINEIDLNGHLLRTFGKNAGNEIDQMNKPRKIAVNGRGDLFVADLFNERIVVLNNQFNVSSIIGRNILFYPQIVYLDEASDLLLVGEFYECMRMVTFQF